MVNEVLLPGAVVVEDLAEAAEVEVDLLHGLLIEQLKGHRDIDILNHLRLEGVNGIEQRVIEHIIFLRHDRPDLDLPEKGDIILVEGLDIIEVVEGTVGEDDLEPVLPVLVKLVLVVQVREGDEGEFIELLDDLCLEVMVDLFHEGLVALLLEELELLLAEIDEVLAVVLEEELQLDGHLVVVQLLAHSA